MANPNNFFIFLMGMWIGFVILGFLVICFVSPTVNVDIVDNQPTAVCDGIYKNDIGVYLCDRGGNGQDVYFTKQSPAFGDKFKEVE